MRKLLVILLLAISQLTTCLINSPSLLFLYQKDFDGIEGWFNRSFINILIKLDELQYKKQIKGNLAEIGVFHGKSFIPLYLLSNADERVLAVDCFDLQQYNYDNSGIGCKLSNFMNNIKKYADPLTLKLELLQGDTTVMTADDYLKKCNNGLPFRIFSIDGSHEAKQTEIDAENALKSLTKGGIIIVDDFFNYGWPGVAEGISRFLINHQEIKAFFIGFNKILLTHKEFVDEYNNYLKQFFKPEKEKIFFDSIVSIYS